MGIQTEVGFTPSQTFKIAEYAAKNEYYSLAMDWLRATESRMKEENDTVSVSAFSLANTYKRNIEKVTEYTNQSIKMSIFHLYFIYKSILCFWIFVSIARPGFRPEQAQLPLVHVHRTHQ